MALPADLLMRSIEPSKRQGLPWLAMIAAALLHILVLLWLFIDWSRPAPLPAEPRVLPVQIVTLPPKPPAPAVAPPAPAPKPPAALSYRESGPDQHTTAPPPAETPAPDTAAPPPPSTEKSPKDLPSPPPEKPAPAPEKSAAPETKSAPRKDLARLEAPKKEAPTPRAPNIAPLRRLNVERGERVETGDPYLNQLYALIERHRIYPKVIGQFGLPVEGAAVYDIAVDRSGKVIGMRLARSSGVAGIDEAVAGMIRSSLPFPPLPPDYPDEVGIVVTIRVFPPS